MRGSPRPPFDGRWHSNNRGPKPFYPDQAEIQNHPWNYREVLPALRHVNQGEASYRYAFRFWFDVLALFRSISPATPLVHPL
jgi:hypothetical protein